ncbi:MAG: bifunctional folylpolyglutamate synthase/dihydrofolate synthase [Tannerellaceae bacterium]|nr:bifunctional folylpolyglutamate synthase/dihydrofolate synthase [Tannerellaceae bacterium]MCD8265432.1 bifunctional folylpolyglutamate synthase/dihydrofolate synthase [Tannerellaceae bacterium]
MTYEETLNYLYTSTPVFQQVGAAAYKPGLDTSIALDNLLGNPHQAYKTIHIAGTNGKGSVSHLLAAILQQSGYKVGLYTSPHLVDFRERIRVNGKMISQEYVVEFVEKYRSSFEPLHPSFFELTSTMAFDYFRHKQVDFAVIETGLGGRLDSTNIITPILSIITNVSRDHIQYLGDTMEKITYEKAGIMKPGVPVIVGEVYYEPCVSLFEQLSKEKEATLYFASNSDLLKESYLMDTGEWFLDLDDFGQLFGQLSGLAQIRNAKTVLAALQLLKNTGIRITKKAVREGFEHVVEITGLRGRWETVQEKPKVICDTGHNEAAWVYLQEHLKVVMRNYKQLHMIIGMANDKDIDDILTYMPQEATYYFTQAAIPRALPAGELAFKGSMQGLAGIVFNTVAEAVQSALESAKEDDLVFIGGSTFVVAEALPLFNNNTNK